MKKVICECGSSKWISTGAAITETIFNGRSWIEYRCANCGKTYNQEQSRPESADTVGIELFEQDDNNNEYGKDIVGDTCVVSISGGNLTETIIDYDATIAEPSKVRYE